MKKILRRMFHILRYIACTPFVLAFGIITAPLSLIFVWKGFYIMYIANQESCSFKKAQEVLAKGDKYNIISNTLIAVNSKHRNNNSFSNSSALDDSEQKHHEEMCSPMYSYLPQNIFYDSN